MPSEKDRLYIALYARGGKPKMPGLEDTYHWAMLVGPKTERANAEGKRFHAKEKLTTVGGKAHITWEFEERSTSMGPTAMILIRILIAKVENMDRLVSVLQSVPVQGDEPGWNCVKWVEDALKGLEGDGRALGTSVTAWATVRDGAMRYVEYKKGQHRFDGKGGFDASKVATWDLMEGKELVP